MTRARRGSAFWVVLLAVVLAPATLLANKQLHKAQISDAANLVVGSAIIQVRLGPTYSYLARTHSRPGGVITKVTLTSTDWGSSVIPLCENGGPIEDDCAYDPAYDNNLDIEGPIGATLLIASGVSSAAFQGALNNGTVVIHLFIGEVEDSSGPFVRIM